MRVHKTRNKIFKCFSLLIENKKILVVLVIVFVFVVFASSSALWPGIHYANNRKTALRDEDCRWLVRRPTNTAPAEVYLRAK